ncbi:hypothetical protein BGW39_002510 [Mortierella sp. 14UC]|nr:hypothetical protein BGW39_002510 [Mortierella sp. 14UC]
MTNTPKCACTFESCHESDDKKTTRHQNQYHEDAVVVLPNRTPGEPDPQCRKYLPSNTPAPVHAARVSSTRQQPYPARPRERQAAAVADPPEPADQGRVKVLPDNAPAEEATAFDDAAALVEIPAVAISEGLVIAAAENPVIAAAAAAVAEGPVVAAAEGSADAAVEGSDAAVVATQGPPDTDESANLDIIKAIIKEEVQGIRRYIDQQLKAVETRIMTALQARDNGSGTMEMCAEAIEKDGQSLSTTLSSSKTTQEPEDAMPAAMSTAQQGQAQIERGRELEACPIIAGSFALPSPFKRTCFSVV